MKAFPLSGHNWKPCPGHPPPQARQGPQRATHRQWRAHLASHAAVRSAVAHTWVMAFNEMAVFINMVPSCLMVPMARDLLSKYHPALQTLNVIKGYYQLFAISTGTAMDSLKQAASGFRHTRTSAVHYDGASSQAGLGLASLWPRLPLLWQCRGLVFAFPSST